MDSIEINKKHIIVVEGKDDELFFQFLLKDMNINEIQIINANGKDNFGNKIEAIIKSKSFEKIEKMFIVRDSEEKKALSAFESIIELLKKKGLPAPNKINTLSEKNPKTCIFIMPNNGDKGMLEDLCIKSIDEKNINCINNFFKCVGKKETNISSKAKVLAFLSTKDKIERNSLLGLGAKNGYWNFSSSVFDELKFFLEKLK